MKPWEVIDEARAPSGARLTLTHRGDEYAILADGKNLMSSRMHASEEALASLGCERSREIDAPCVLVGGLGMGYTLRATLDLLPKNAKVVVSELLSTVVDWNRGPLAMLAKRPLEDKRVTVEIGDVADTLKSGPARFDAILLDVDNGASAFTQARNGRLYSKEGLEIARTALRPGGTLAVWSAAEDPAFERRLRQAAFEVKREGVRGRLAKGAPRHSIFLGFVGKAPPKAGAPKWRYRSK